MSSPDRAGTGAFVAGSIFMAMVPPVAIIWHTGNCCSAALAGLDEKPPYNEKTRSVKTRNGRIAGIVFPEALLLHRGRTIRSSRVKIKRPITLDEKNAYRCRVAT